METARGRKRRPKGAIEFRYSHPLPEGGAWTWTIGPFSNSTNTDSGNTATRDIRARVTNLLQHSSGDGAAHPAPFDR